jgi:hypothetical protein
MIEIHCADLEQVDAIWRLLAHVPDEAFAPCDVFLDGVFRYRVIRSDGEQTTARPAGLPVSTNPAP